MTVWNVTPTSSPSLAQVEQLAKPGDEIVIAGTFKNYTLMPGLSGTSTAPITYKAATPLGATFDGPGQYGVFNTAGRSFITLDGIGFANSNYINAPVINKGLILRNSSYITVKNCNFSNMQMQLIGSSHCKIGDQNAPNTWRYFVASFFTDAAGVKHPLTSGDMLNLVLNSHDNEICYNDMKYGGHSLIQIGNGKGNTEQNANNRVHHNNLSNPWYVVLQLSDDGAGTIFEYNNILDANSVPTLYSTIAGQTGALKRSSQAIEISAENFIVRNNLIANAVAAYGVIGFGGRWYRGAGAAAGGTLVEAMNNQVYGNKIQDCRAAAVFSFEENYVPGVDASIPRITGNDIHHNDILRVATSGADTYDHAGHFETFLYRSFMGAGQWQGLNGNKAHDNTGVSQTNAYRASYVDASKVTHTQVDTLAQLNSLDPNCYANS